MGMPHPPYWAMTAIAMPASRPLIRIAVNIALDGALAALAVPLARWIADPADVWLYPLWLMAGGAGAVLFDPLRTALGEYAALDFIKALQVVPAELGGDAGLVGAAALLRDEARFGATPHPGLL